MTNRLIALLVFMALLSPISAYASFDVSLKYGMSGSAVLELQDLLVSEKCLTVNPTGYFGMLTLNAVKCFQTKYSLPSTGYFGVMSRTVANSLSVASIEESNSAELQETGFVSTTSQPTIQEPTVGASVQLPEPIKPSTSVSVSEPYCYQSAPRVNISVTGDWTTYSGTIKAYEEHNNVIDPQLIASHMTVSGLKGKNNYHSFQVGTPAGSYPLIIKVQNGSSEVASYYGEVQIENNCQ